MGILKNSLQFLAQSGKHLKWKQLTPADYL